ncbi:MAG: hypothetical protein LUD41_00970 [Phascolarctobacterium sp.]|nr:hypothetical protein [Phascolarctobacterium sp.]
MEYKNKISLHIPHYAWDGRLKPINYKWFKCELVATLSDIGIDSCFSVAADGYYNGRGFEEEVITVFCNNPGAVVRAMTDTFKQCNRVMHQAAFTYELDGTLHIIPLTEEEK